MKHIQCAIETFRKIQQESEPWSVREWSPDNEEPQHAFEPQIVEGGIDVDDIQFYMGIRDDRVGVMFKNGSLISVMDSLDEFRRKLARVGI